MTTQQDEELLKAQLDQLKQEHSELKEILSNSIEELDEVSLYRLKKRKLFLKDKILELSRLLFPDIIA